MKTDTFYIAIKVKRRFKTRFFFQKKISIVFVFSRVALNIQPKLNKRTQK